MEKVDSSSDFNEGKTHRGMAPSGADQLQVEARVPKDFQDDPASLVLNQNVVHHMSMDIG